MRGRFLAVLIGGALTVLATAARADELAQLNRQILRDPSNLALNIRYAQLAEARGKPRLALAAYERLLVAYPDNPEVQAGLQRIRRKLQPNVTQVFLELGALWESNPRRLSTGSQSEWEAIARMLVRDERTLGDVRWRTLGNFIAEAHARYGDLSYGYAGGVTGPVIDVLPGLAMHASVGGGASYFDHRLFYGEGVASLAFESYLEGAFQVVRVRAGYRDYNDFFPSSHGFYADVIGKFSRPDVFGPGDVVIFSPWVRVSAIEGPGITVTFEQVQPGKYTEYGARLEYYRRVLAWLSLGANIAVTDRNYASSFNLVTGLPSKRRDTYVSPGATAIIHHVFGYQTDVRVDYRHEDNDSNDPLRSYINHLVAVMLLTRF